MKKQTIGMGVALAMLGGTGNAYADMVTIGTAQFGGTGTEYNLIWDDDNNGNSVVWLDYTNSGLSWNGQVAWVTSLGPTLTYNIDTAYKVTWDTDWRLGSTVDDELQYSNNGGTSGGYHNTNSEMGHLFYEELGNTSFRDYFDDPNISTWGLLNTGDFENLQQTTDWYWSSTTYEENPSTAWYFDMIEGDQWISSKAANYGDGLALRSGSVTAATPVPEPGTKILFGTGLLGLAASRRKKKSLA